MLLHLTPSRLVNQAAVNEDLRTAIRHAALHCKPTTLLLSESDVPVSLDGLLQQLNSLVCTGEVPGLFTKDEITVMLSELSHLVSKQVRSCFT